MDKKRNSQFCKQLEVAFGEAVSDAEKCKAQKELGPLSAQHRLSFAGFRHLFQSLSQDIEQQSGPKE